MKSLLLLLLILLLSSCNNSQDRVSHGVSSVEDHQDSSKEVLEKYPIIEEGRVGIFKIGKPIPTEAGDYEINKEIRKRFTDDGPVEEPVYVSSDNNEEILNLKTKYNHRNKTYTDTVSEIIVLSDRFRTARDIGVKSSIEEFTAAYPNYKIWYTYVSDMYVLESESLRAQFILNEKDFTGELQINSVKTPLDINDFREGSRIEKVRLL